MRFDSINHNKFHHQPLLLPSDSDTVKPLIEKINKIKEILDTIEGNRYFDGFFDLMFKKNQMTNQVKNLQEEISQGCNILKSAGVRSLDVELQLLEVSNKIQQMTKEGKLDSLAMKRNFVL